MIKGIHHFSFTVSNLKETIHFFHDLLGLEVTPLREAKGKHIENIIKMQGASLNIRNVITPDKGTIEFIEYVVPKGSKIDLKTCNPGVAHIAFVVDDIQKMYHDLTNKGVQFNSPPLWIKSGARKGLGQCYLKGPDGITLEFMELPKGK